jgi:hypothetical protein
MSCSYTKFKKFLKPINWELTCPYPGDDVVDRISKQRNAKMVPKKKRKKMQSSISAMQGNNA